MDFEIISGSLSRKMRRSYFMKPTQILQSLSTNQLVISTGSTLQTRTPSLRTSSCFFSLPSEVEIITSIELDGEHSFSPVEQTSFAMPQVVADGRKEFESLFKPYKKNMKFIHTLDTSSNQWKV